MRAIRAGSASAADDLLHGRVAAATAPSERARARDPTGTRARPSAPRIGVATSPHHAASECWRPFEHVTTPATRERGHWRGTRSWRRSHGERIPGVGRTDGPSLARSHRQRQRRCASAAVLVRGEQPRRRAAATTVRGEQPHAHAITRVARERGDVHRTHAKCRVGQRVLAVPQRDCVSRAWGANAASAAAPTRAAHSDRRERHHLPSASRQPMVAPPGSSNPLSA